MAMVGLLTLDSIRVGSVTSTSLRVNLGDSRTDSGPMPPTSSGAFPGQRSTTSGFLPSEMAGRSAQNKTKKVSAHATRFMIDASNGALRFRAYHMTTKVTKDTKDSKTSTCAFVYFVTFVVVVGLILMVLDQNRYRHNVPLRCRQMHIHSAARNAVRQGIRFDAQEQIAVCASSPLAANAVVRRLDLINLNGLAVAAADADHLRRHPRARVEPRFRRIDGNCACRWLDDGHWHAQLAIDWIVGVDR